MFSSFFKKRRVAAIRKELLNCTDSIASVNHVIEKHRALSDWYCQTIGMYPINEEMPADIQHAVSVAFQQIKQMEVFIEASRVPLAELFDELNTQLYIECNEA